jgi:DNA-binding transcriptional regulator YbjK
VWPVPRPVAQERRDSLLDAALEVVVESGMRGLTHRAVDRAADVSEGTTSGYFRTRRALQLALAQRIAQRISGDVDAMGAELLSHEPTEDEIRSRVVDLFARWLASPLLVAKVELTLEATRDPDLAAIVNGDRARVIGIVENLLTECPRGERHQRASTLMAALDGILIEAMLRPASERAAYLADAVALAMTGLGEPSR